MRTFPASLPIIFLIVMVTCSPAGHQERNQRKNLALVAEAASSIRYSPSMDFLNDGLTPVTKVPVRQGSNRPGQRLGSQWIEYKWSQPVTFGEVEVFWWDNSGSARLPGEYIIKYWNGSDFVPVGNPSGLGLENNRFNATTFDPVETSRLRLEMDSAERNPCPILEWKVIQTAGSRDHPLVVCAGPDRTVVKGGKTYLSGRIRSVTPLTKTEWKKKSGPGTVTFDNGREKSATAQFSETGDYILTLTAKEGSLTQVSELRVRVTPPPPEKRLDVVYTKRYRINSPLWNSRAKALIVNWIPWCIDQIERDTLTLGPGGLDNFIEAAKALGGEAHGRHKGYVFSNAWVYQTIESMCLALMVDPGGDPDIIKAQEKMKSSLAKWIPVVLAAQEPDGYLMTAYTLRDTARWKERWEPRARGNHEGYVAGYFIESAINHYTLTEGSDRRLYDAARRLADCWVRNIGPGKREWFDGHQEMEQALVRFGRFVNDMEGNGKGDDYIKLAKFLLDNRKDGSEYDQSHVPVQQQYEAVGHAVRAVYSYSAMADIAAETGDLDYQSAVISLWENIVNKKYYVTGGIGSGETSEGFGPDYSLGNDAYCESCSSCGLIFFQYKMNLAYHDAKYADLYEETIYNALLGSVDLTGRYFYYDNPLNSAQSRYQWHVCPCCVGNIPRTLLMIPTWTYVKGSEGLYVNLFIGSTINVGKVAGTSLEIIQQTDYPWSGKVTLTVNPEEEKEFAIFIRVPDRSTSLLYTPVPEVRGLESISVNGEIVPFRIDKGYAEVRRKWKSGDRINFQIPMEVQTITADERIVANRWHVALRYGPLVYNAERADQPDIDNYISSGPLRAVWREDLLGGVMVINGNWSDGSILTAIPNYARNNRNKIEFTYAPGPENRDGGSKVWIRKSK